MTYTIKSFIAADGERFSQLYDSQEYGFPLFYPSAFIARAIRLRTSHETQKVYLNAIKLLYEWEATKKFTLEIRFQKRAFLTLAEVDDLARHLSASRRGKKGETIGRTKSSIYIGYTAKYIHWLATEVVTDSNTPNVASAIAEQDARLKEKTMRKRGSRSADAERLLAKRLSEPASEQLIDLFAHPFQKISRTVDRGPRLRNVVMLRILYETGMRRGELLSQKLSSLVESSGSGHAFLKIERNHHDEFDSRVNQPVTKTRGRVVPISFEVETQIMEYISEHRALIRGVGFSNEDFIFVNHRAGKSQGTPLSESALHAALKNLKTSFPALGEIYPHLLRHDWNYRFSQRAKLKAMPPNREREVREVLMGWTSGSEMSGIYNRRHVEEEAALLGLDIACSTQRKQ